MSLHLAINPGRAWCGAKRGTYTAGPSRVTCPKCRRAYLTHQIKLKQRWFNALVDQLNKIKERALTATMEQMALIAERDGLTKMEFLIGTDLWRGEECVEHPEITAIEKAYCDNIHNTGFQGIWENGRWRT